MRFTRAEVDLIRRAAALMPLRSHQGDTGKAQLSALADAAQAATEDQLIMELDVRRGAHKIDGRATDALKRVVSGMTAGGWRTGRGEGEEEYVSRKRAVALHYVNKLRVRPQRSGGPQGSTSDG